MVNLYADFINICNFRFVILVPMIIGEIRRHLRDSGAVKVSRSLKDIAYKSLSAKEVLTAKLGREPNFYEIARELNTDAKLVAEAMEAICDPVSLFEPIYNDGGYVIMVKDQISDKEDKEEKWVSDISLSDAMEKLNEKEKRILKMRFYQDKTQMEIADEIGISQAQVSRLEKNAINSMKKFI